MVKTSKGPSLLRFKKIDSLHEHKRACEPTGLEKDYHLQGKQSQSHFEKSLFSRFFFVDSKKRVFCNSQNLLVSDEFRCGFRVLESKYIFLLGFQSNPFTKIFGFFFHLKSLKKFPEAKCLL